MPVIFFTESPPFRQRLFHMPGQFFHSNTIKSRQKTHLEIVTNASMVCKPALFSGLFIPDC
ncbi:MAG: hypothetical protein GY760_18350 [Deltaproteobacteria bacterium]|nr:hypothetical protein [Deltaproteobacteria bacterium]